MRRLSAIVAVAFAMGLPSLACSLLPVKTGPSGISDAHAIATAVQATVEAFQPAAQTPSGQVQETSPALETAADPTAPAPTPTRAPVPGVLPDSLYFLAPDTQGRQQVWRLATDAHTFYAVTAEAADVTDYDVSRDGALAYVAQNQLLLRTVNAGGRRVLADGGADDGSDTFRFTKTIAGLSWSPDGNTLAYGLNGIHLLQVEDGNDSVVLPNDIENLNGLLVPRALYQPDRWSPDGTRLLITIGFYEGATKAVYLPGSKTVVQLTKGGQGFASCCTASWSPDGQAVFSAGYVYGSMGSDLWRYDAATGQGTQLIPEIAPDGSFNHANWPVLGSGGKLFYFFANLSSMPSSDVLLQMTRSDPDGVTGRTFLRTDPVLLSEALWAPDGSLAVAVLPAPGVYDYPAHGQIAILFAGEQPLTQIVKDGRLLRWGP